MVDKREQFIKEIYAQTYQLAKDNGIPHDFIMAQIIQETGWGKHILEGTHNIFNIKADSSWKGETSSHKVWEIEHGKKVWVDAKFRKYTSYEESVKDWLKFLHDNKRYTALFEEKNLSIEEFAHRIQDAGYATDPHYAENIIRITQGKTYLKLVGKAKEAYEATHKVDEDNLELSLEHELELELEELSLEHELENDSKPIIENLPYIEGENEYHAENLPYQEKEIKDDSELIELLTDQKTVKHFSDYYDAEQDMFIFDIDDYVNLDDLAFVDSTETTDAPKKDTKTETSCEIPPWMTIAIEQAKEIHGRNEHQVDAMIRKYHKGATGSELKGADTAWCASFVSWALAEAGMHDTPRSAGSRFFRDESDGEGFGKGLKPIPKGEERLGDIAVWANLDKHGNYKGSGHVSFVIGKDKDGKELFLGGNQGNTLGVKHYATEDTPHRAFVGFFRPEEAENTSTICPLPQYDSAKEANREITGQDIELGDSTR